MNNHKNIHAVDLVIIIANTITVAYHHNDQFYHSNNNNMFTVPLLPGHVVDPGCGQMVSALMGPLQHLVCLTEGLFGYSFQPTFV